MRIRSAIIILALTVGAPVADAAAQEVSIFRYASGAWLGFSYSAQTESIDGERRTRVVVNNIVDDSPASRAGLREGDEVVSVNDLRATTALLSSLSSSLEPGDDVDLQIRRDGSTRTVTITAAERPEEYSSRATWTFNADSVVALTRSMLDSLRVRVDSLQLPSIRIERSGDGGSVFLYRDGHLDTLTFHQDSLFPTRLFSDSMRMRMDSVLVRLARPGIHIDISSDSLIMLDSTRVHLLPKMRTQWQWPDSAGYRGVTLARSFMRAGMRALAGMSLEEVGPMLGEYFGTDRGLLVLEVAPETPAARAGLREGDVIMNVDGADVTTIGELRDAVADADDTPLTLTVLRQRNEIQLTLTPSDD